MKEICRNCRFYYKGHATFLIDGSKTEYFISECRRYAPVNGQFPTIREEQFCGEWAEKQYDFLNEDKPESY